MQYETQSESVLEIGPENFSATEDLFSDAMKFERQSEIDVWIVAPNGHADVTVQFSLDGETYYNHPDAAYTIAGGNAVVHDVISVSDGGVYYRIGILAGDYVDGSMTLRLSQ